MKPEGIGKAYNQITHLWQSDDFNRENGIAQHKRALQFVKIQENKKAKALDVGCGCTGRFIDLLLAEGFQPEGVDISSEMLRLAKERHPEVVFHQQDICQWDIVEKYDFISAWDSIWHIPLDQQVPVLTKLIESLNSKGVLIFSFGGTDEEGFHNDDFMGPEVHYSTLGINGFLQLFLSLDCTCRHLEFDQYPELHTYFIIQKN